MSMIIDDIGIFSYMVFVTDGCSFAIESFDIVVLPFQAWAQFVHLSPTAPGTVSFRLQGTEQAVSRTFPGGVPSGGAGWFPLNSPDAVIELVVDGEVIGEIDDLEIDYFSAFVVVVHDVDGAWTYFQYEPDESEPVADTYGLTFFHAADGVGPVSVWSDEETPTALFEDVDFGEFADSTLYLDGADALSVLVDATGDDEADFRVSLGAGSLFNGSNYVAFAYLNAAGSLGVFFLELDIGIDAWFGYSATVQNLNMASLSVVHLASNAPPVVRLAMGDMVLASAGYAEVTTAPSGVTRGATTHVEVATDGTYVFLDGDNEPTGIEVTLDLMRQTRNTLVFYDDDGGVGWAIFADNDDELTTPDGRVGFFHGADGVGDVTVTLEADGTALFEDVAMGELAANWLELDASSGNDQYPILVYIDDDMDPSFSYTLSRPSIWPLESTVVFAYLNADGALKFFNRAFNVNTGSMFRYYHTPTPITPPVAGVEAMWDAVLEAWVASRPDYEMAIPDNDSTGISDGFFIDGACEAVVGVEVTINLSHSWPGDVRIGLTPPGGTRVQVAAVTGSIVVSE
jgi:hypothetical protein